MQDSDQAYTVFTFVSTHHALKAEQILKQEQLKPVIIPVPRQVSSLCGLAIRVAKDRRGAAEDVLRTKGVGLEGIFDFN